MNDEHLIELFFKRDEQALRGVEKQYGRLCFSIAFNILHDHPEAEQCVNDTYLAAWDSIPPNRPVRLSAYLARIARNKALNRLERSKSKRRGGELETLISELSEDIPGQEKTDDLLNKHYVTDIINKYLHCVPKNKAAIFVQRYFMCCSLDEICEFSGYSYNKVAVTLHRMKTELIKKLRDEGVEV